MSSSATHGKDEAAHSHAHASGLEVNMPQTVGKSFTPGYIKRAIEFSQTGTHYPWQNTQDVGVDMKDLAAARLEDGVLRFTQTETSLRCAA